MVEVAACPLHLANAQVSDDLMSTLMLALNGRPRTAARMDVEDGEDGEDDDGEELLEGFASGPLLEGGSEAGQARA